MKNTFCAKQSSDKDYFPGNLSHTMGLSIDEVADKGPGLAFIAYPRALAMLKEYLHMNKN